jgi:hypothetical protein
MLLLLLEYTLLRQKLSIHREHRDLYAESMAALTAITNVTGCYRFERATCVQNAFHANMHARAFLWIVLRREIERPKK